MPATIAPCIYHFGLPDTRTIKPEGYDWLAGPAEWLQLIRHSDRKRFYACFEDRGQLHLITSLKPITDD